MEDYENTPPGKQLIKFNTVFDVKMEDLRKEAMLVTGGPMTKAPTTKTYASFVSYKTVRIVLTISELNGFKSKHPSQ